MKLLRNIFFEKFKIIFFSVFRNFFSKKDGLLKKGTKRCVIWWDTHLFKLTFKKMLNLTSRPSKKLPMNESDLYCTCDVNCITVLPRLVRARTIKLTTFSFFELTERGYYPRGALLHYLFEGKTGTP